VLLAILAVVAIFAFYRLYGNRTGLGSSSIGEAPKTGNYQVPVLGYESNGQKVVPTPVAIRSLFTFGAPPTPTPDLRPTPTPLPTLPPVIYPTPTPDCIPVPDGRCLPRPGQCPLTYIGWLGPDRLPVAVFRDGEEILTVKEGETIKGRYVLQKVGPAFVTVGFVDYPQEVTQTVQLAR
jgi:hypothetical protein